MYNEAVDLDKVKVICPWSIHRGKIGKLTDAGDLVHILFDDELEPISFDLNMIAKVTDSNRKSL